MTEMSVNLTFLPEDKEAIEKFLDRAEKSKSRELVARLADFEDFFDTVVRTKESLKIGSVSIAVRMMVDFANTHMDEHNIHPVFEQADD